MKIKELLKAHSEHLKDMNALWEQIKEYDNTVEEQVKALVGPALVYVDHEKLEVCIAGLKDKEGLVAKVEGNWVPSTT